jgi:multiple sugar transport system substrate-binding protein
MSSKKTLARIAICAGLAGLFALSLRGPDRQGHDLSLLMEPDGSGLWRELVNDFNTLHPGVRVQLVEGPPPTDTREDMYSISFLSGEAAYDIVYCDVIWTPKFAAAGWLLDLTDRLSPADAGDFLQADLAASRYQGRLYRVPAFTDAGILYYRRDLVSSPPETFDELEGLAKRLESSDRAGFLWQGKQYEGLVTVYLEMLWGFGGDWIDGNTRQVFLDGPEAVRALEFLKRTLGTISPAAVTTYTEEETRTLFQNGRSVFLRNWPYVWRLMDQGSLKKGVDVAMAPVVHAPGFPSAATLGGWGFAVSRFTRNPEAAWEFVEFMTAPRQLSRVQSRLGRIPARRSLVPPEFAAILGSARMRPPIPEYAQASDILQRWLSAALTGRITAEDALKQAARETRSLLGI